MLANGGREQAVSAGSRLASAIGSSAIGFCCQVLEVLMFKKSLLTVVGPEE